MSNEYNFDQYALKFIGAINELEATNLRQQEKINKLETELAILKTVSEVKNRNMAIMISSIIGIASILTTIVINLIK